MVQEELQEQRPSKDDEFMKRFGAMMSAVENGEVAKVQVLLQDDPALLNAKGHFYPAGDEDVTPFLVATCFNQQEIAMLLLKSGADPTAEANGDRAMHSAAFHGNRELADALVGHGVPMDIFAAAGLGDVERVKAFLVEDPDLISVGDTFGATPLHWAGSVEVAQLLLDAGADIEATDSQYGNTPAEYICRPEVSKFLISKGARVRIYLACSIGDVAAARRLLEDDPTLLNIPSGNCRPEAHTLPLSIAASYGQLAIVQFLCDFGINVNAPNERRGAATALHFAARGGHYEIADVLLRHGANVAASTRKGETPLDWALMGQSDGWGTWSGNPHPPRHQEVIDLLIEIG